MRFSRIVSMLCASFFALALVATTVDARVGGGGSRGSRTFSAPPLTRTAPTAAQPMQRSVTQPGQPGGSFANRPAANNGGFFNRPGGLFGGGLLGGLAAGFIGAGLFGMLFGHGFMGGLGGFASILGLLIQIGLVIIVARLAFAWWQRRNQPAMASANGANGSMMRNMLGGSNGASYGGSSGGASASGPSDEIGIQPADYDAFEKLLGEIQQAYSNEDLGGLRKVATPEMVSYFSEDMAENASHGLLNRVSDVRLVSGDLSEAWREGNVEYATVAMRFSLVDQMIERSSGRVVQGDTTPEEVTEIWTFLRASGGHWVLSAIQQV